MTVTIISDLDASVPANSAALSGGAGEIRDLKTAALSLNTATATKGSAQIGHLDSATNAQAQTVRGYFLFKPVTPATFGAVGDGSTDDLTPLNRFFAAVAAGRKGDLGYKTYAISAALTAVSASDNLQVGGDGGTILYTGAGTTPGNLLTFSGSSSKHIELRDWRIRSSTTLTASAGADYAIKVSSYLRGIIDLHFDGDYALLGKLYKGLYLDACTDINLAQSHFYCQTHCVSLKSCIEVYFGHSFMKGDGTNGTAVLLGGNNGGINFQDAKQLLHSVGVKIDNTLNAASNLQIFFGRSQWDTNATYAANVDDNTSNALSKVISLEDAWFASTVSGPGFNVTNWTGGTITAGSAHFLNNSTDGFKTADTSILYHDTGAVDCRSNGGYGFNSTGALSIYSQSYPRLNTSGAFHKNIIRRTPWGAQLTLTVANGASAVLPRLSGNFHIANPDNGAVGVYTVGGAQVSKASASNSTWATPPVLPATPSAGTAAVQYDGVADYKLYNNYGSSQDFLVTITVARESV